MPYIQPTQTTQTRLYTPAYIPSTLQQQKEMTEQGYQKTTFETLGKKETVDALVSRYAGKARPTYFYTEEGDRVYIVGRERGGKRVLVYSESQGRDYAVTPAQLGLTAPVQQATTSYSVSAGTPPSFMKTTETLRPEQKQARYAPYSPQVQQAIIEQKYTPANMEYEQERKTAEQLYYKPPLFIAGLQLAPSMAQVGIFLQEKTGQLSREQAQKAYKEESIRRIQGFVRAGKEKDFGKFLTYSAPELMSSPTFAIPTAYATGGLLTRGILGLSTSVARFSPLASKAVNIGAGAGFIGLTGYETARIYKETENQPSYVRTGQLFTLGTAVGAGILGGISTARTITPKQYVKPVAKPEYDIVIGETLAKAKITETGFPSKPYQVDIIKKATLLNKEKMISYPVQISQESAGMFAEGATGQIGKGTTTTFIKFAGSKKYSKVMRFRDVDTLLSNYAVSAKGNIKGQYAGAYGKEPYKGQYQYAKLSEIQEDIRSVNIYDLIAQAKGKKTTEFESGLLSVEKIDVTRTKVIKPEKAEPYSDVINVDKALTITEQKTVKLTPQEESAILSSVDKMTNVLNSKAKNIELKIEPVTEAKTITRASQVARTTEKVLAKASERVRTTQLQLTAPRTASKQLQNLITPQRTLPQSSLAQPQRELQLTGQSYLQAQSYIQAQRELTVPERPTPTIPRTPAPPSRPYTGIPFTPVLPKPSLNLINFPDRSPAKPKFKLMKPKTKKLKYYLEPDILSKTKSLQIYGKATPIKKGTKYAKIIEQKGIGVRVPTLEQAKIMYG